MPENEKIIEPIVIDIQEEEIIEVEVTEAFPSAANGITHDSLPDRNLSGAHVITAIEGLRDELDEIERLKTVYSDKKNNADYYEWADGNKNADNRTGLFVSLCNDISKISICTGDNIFGVIVDSAAFIGGQDNNKRGTNYGLVATTGGVFVRCTLNVNKGDYVISDAYGVAVKSSSNYGYKVVAIHYMDNSPYATINLTISGDQVHKVGVNLKDLNSRMDSAEFNITSVANVANAAYKRAGEVVIVSQDISNKVDNALGEVGNISSSVEELSEQLKIASQISVQAKELANSASLAAVSMRNEAVEQAKDALVNTTALRKDFASMEEGIKQFDNRVDIIEKNTSEHGTAIAGIRTKVDDQSSTIDSLTSWQSDTKTAMARIEQKADENGAYIQSTVSNMDKYSVGPYSQSYGFTEEQAKTVLEKGMVYVPTVTHTESFSSTKETSFTQGWHYTWDGDKWVVSTSVSVKFIDEYVTGTSNTPYWYIPSDSNITYDDIEYKAHTLYKWEMYDEDLYHWVAVATLEGNSQSRAVSKIRQDTNSIEMAVTTVDKKYAGTKKWIDDNKAAIQSTVSWKGENADSISTFMQTAGENFASASQVAKIVDDSGNIKAAEIVTAVNDAGSSVVINADHIKFDGYVSFASKDDVKEVQDSAIYDTKVEYALSSSSDSFIAVNGDDGKWSSTAPVWRENTYMWQKTTVSRGDGTSVSTQTCIQGAKGLDGQPGTPGAPGNTPYIKNGNWWIGSSDTGVKAEGTDATPPTITIVNGYWYVDGKNTNVKAQGTDGQPAPTVTKVTKQYYLSSSNTSLVSGSWSDSPSIFTKNKYMWTREKYTMSAGNPIYSDPVLDNTFTTISGWCSANNQTLIDGANIATGTVTADRMTVLDSNEKVVFNADASSHEVNVGGFVANSYALQSSDTVVGMSSQSGNGLWAIWAGSGDYGDKPFRVGHAGELIATNANITGRINATSGSFNNCTIGGWHINNEGILSSKYVNGGSVVTNKTISGVMYPSIEPEYEINGVVTPVISSGHSLVRTSQFSPVRFMAGCTPNYVPASQENLDAYISLVDNTRFMVLEDGSLYAANAQFATKVTLSHEGFWTDNFIEWTYEGLRSNSGTTVDTTMDKNGLQTNLLGYNPGSGYMAFGQSTNTSAGSTQFSAVNFVHGLRIVNSYYSTDISILAGKKSAIQITASSTSNQAGVGTTLSSRLCSSWYADSAITVDSDCNLKNSIQSIPEAYEIAFDNLKSTIFKYNDGTSDRYHTGFVAQEVDDAIAKAGLSRKDFAALCISDEGTEDERWGLRYSEFVSLNTWQIQKLKSRISELEERISQLENK